MNMDPLGLWVCGALTVWIALYLTRDGDDLSGPETIGLAAGWPATLLVLAFLTLISLACELVWHIDQTLTRLRSKD